jgi:hypothetical protein
MEYELDQAAEHTTVIPAELEQFAQSIQMLTEAIAYISSEIFNPDEYYLSQGIDLLDVD